MLAAVGAALSAYHLLHGKDRLPIQGVDGMSGAFFGPAFPQREIERSLAAAGARFTVLADDELICCARERWLTGARSDGIRGGWSSAHGPSAVGRFLRMPGHPRCRRC
jgi:carbamoyltransferase